MNAEEDLRHSSPLQTLRQFQSSAASWGKALASALHGVPGLSPQGSQATAAAAEESRGRGTPVGGLNYLWQARANALNRFRSHGSAVVVSSSGCHCTPTIHQSLPVHSTPSITPSGACATAVSPGAIDDTA